MIIRKFKFVPYNLKNVGDIADATPLTLSIIGIARTPYRPLNFCANGGSFAARYNTDIVLTWSPRYRGKGAGIGIPGVVLPDSYIEGFFKVEVWVGGVKMRTMTEIDAATWTYTEAMNIEDNGSPASPVTFKVSNYKVSFDDGQTYESAQMVVICKKN